MYNIYNITRSNRTFGYTSPKNQGEFLDTKATNNHTWGTKPKQRSRGFGQGGKGKLCLDIIHMFNPTKNLYHINSQMIFTMF